MLKKLRLPFMLFGTALMLLGPTGAFARDHDHDDYWRHERYEHHHHRRHHVRVQVYYGPRYSYGYYDRWGYWHPYR